MRLLYSSSEIEKAVEKTVDFIKKTYRAGEEILAVCVLNGAVLFFADLIKLLPDYKLIFDFISASAYKGEHFNISQKIEGRNVLIIEDIVDTGLTLEYLKKCFMLKGAGEVKCVSLLDKPAARKVNINPDFAALTLKGLPFVVGYGLDLNGLYRNLKDIYVIE